MRHDVFMFLSIGRKHADGIPASGNRLVIIGDPSVFRRVSLVLLDQNHPIPHRFLENIFGIPTN